MKWILIGMLLGSTITSEHDTREACEGRNVLLKEKGVIAKCVEVQTFSLTFGGTCTNCITVPTTLNWSNK